MLVTPNVSDHALAARLVAVAGDLLLDLRAAAAAGEADAAELGREGDRRSNQLLVEVLRSVHPDDVILSEESADDLRRLTAERVWIIDPLDGTREFTEFHRTDWAVHVALVVDGVPTAAAVALPARHIVLSTADAPPLPPRRASSVRMVVSRTRPPAFAAALAEGLEAELVPMGSAGAKAMAILLDEADVYVHDGGQYEWDSAAPVGVAAAAGLHTSRLDGSVLRYNNPSPWLPDVVFCRPELADSVLGAVGLTGRRAPLRPGLDRGSAARGHSPTGR